VPQLWNNESILQLNGTQGLLETGPGAPGKQEGSWVVGAMMGVH
jgi:hypothetical protein